jgi:phosphoheptose isomerase
MATSRYRYGDPFLISLTIGDSNQTVNINDMCYMSSNKVYPAGNYTWTSNLATTQNNFAANFLGIAREDFPRNENALRSSSSTTVAVDVSADSVYSFDVASATVNYGAAMAPADSGSSTLMPQKLVATGNTRGIARTIKAYTSATTAVYVQFASAYTASSGNSAAQVG